MYAWYKSKGMSLSGVPELNSVIPAGAYYLVRGFGMEAGTEDSGFMAIHDIRWIAAYET